MLIIIGAFGNDRCTDLGRLVPLAKIFCFLFDPNHRPIPCHPVPARGAYRDRHGRRLRDAMDAAASARAIACGRMVLSRTAKPCGPDAPTLAFKLVMMLRITLMMVARKPGHQGERVISRQPIAQEMPGVPVTCGDYPVCTLPFAHGLRVHRAPGVSCALVSFGRTLLQTSGASCRENAELRLPSFRGDAKHRTTMCNCTSENLGIPRCAIAHLRSGPSDHPGMTVFLQMRANALPHPPLEGRVDAKRRGGVEPRNEAAPSHPGSHFATLNVSRPSPPGEGEERPTTPAHC